MLRKFPSRRPLLGISNQGFWINEPRDRRLGVLPVRRQPIHAQVVVTCLGPDAGFVINEYNNGRITTTHINPDGGIHFKEQCR